MKKILLACVMSLLLTACSAGEGPALPGPADLFAEIDRSAELSEMVDLAEVLLEEELGIPAEEYESAVYYLVEEGLAPDEIVIVKAADEAAAARILEKLEDRLDYKAESAKLYLTEFLPVIEKGVVRQDGLTCSLLVSGQVEQIQEVYGRYE